jgi:hypothetical protein
MIVKESLSSRGRGRENHAYSLELLMIERKRAFTKRMKRYDKQKAAYRQPSKGAAGPCVSLITGEIIKPPKPPAKKQ